MLGWEITRDGGDQPTRERAWKVRLLIRALLQRGRSSSQVLEKLIGHCSFLSLARRECFAIFGGFYKFIQKYKRRSKEVALWKGVRRELDIFDGAIPLIYRDMSAPWSTCVHAADASLPGMGVTSTQDRYPIELVQRLGRVQERWQFHDTVANNPRQRVLQDDTSLGQGTIVFEDNLKQC